MEIRIDNNRWPMLVMPPKALGQPKIVTTDLSAEGRKDATVLENGKVIESGARIAKGTFVDLYV